MNILSNALDAVEELRIEQCSAQRDVAEVERSLPTKTYSKTPCIRIRTELGESDTVVIRIADNGTGMSPQVQQQIFDPFFTTKPVGQGTGLGLSISYQIVVDKHGGQLTCMSQLGEGTEFLIELPVKLSEHQTGASTGKLIVNEL
jgi:signal transduction histidine kinase